MAVQICHILIYFACKYALIFHIIWQTKCENFLWEFVCLFLSILVLGWELLNNYFYLITKVFSLFLLWQFVIKFDTYFEQQQKKKKKSKAKQNFFVNNVHSFIIFLLLSSVAVLSVVNNYLKWQLPLINKQANKQTFLISCRVSTTSFIFFAYDNKRYTQQDNFK